MKMENRLVIARCHGLEVGGQTDQEGTREPCGNRRYYISLVVTITQSHTKSKIARVYIHAHYTQMSTGIADEI